MASDRGKWARFKSVATKTGRETVAWSKWGAGRARAGWQAMGANRYTAATRAGIAETFGFQYGGLNYTRYEGFLGVKETPLYSALERNRARTFSKGYKVGRNLGRNATVKTFGGLIGRAIIPAFTAYSMYSGYKESGLIGAAKAGAEEAAMWGGFRLAGAVLGSAGTWAVGGLAAAGYGYYALGEASRAHVKRLRHLEMGAPIKDPYGTAATMRARSLQALNSSVVNGRMAMGNEALLLHDSAYSPAFRR